MSNFEYIRKHYNVPAEIGRKVVVDGKRGVIIKDCGKYIGVNFDEDKPWQISNCHPAWRVEYLGLGKIRRRTRSQERYQRYLEHCDSFDSFIHFCYWDAEPSQPWNKGE